MVPPAPTPSSRLLRAAAAEREELGRHRTKLLSARDSLRAELASIDASLRALDERDALLDRLAGPVAAAAGHRADPAGADARSGGPEASGAPTALVAPAPAAPGPAPAAGADVAPARTPLRGPAIRRAAVEVLLTHPERPEALHYRAWFAALRDAGYTVAGKDPLAVFLTQLSRSPVVRRGTQSGVYALDPGAPRRLRDELDALHAELRGIAATPAATADLTAIRGRRAALTTQITQVEKALEEAEGVLGARPGAPVAAAG